MKEFFYDIEKKYKCGEISITNYDARNIQDTNTYDKVCRLFTKKVMGGRMIIFGDISFTWNCYLPVKFNHQHKVFRKVLWQ